MFIKQPVSGDKTFAVYLIGITRIYESRQVHQLSWLRISVVFSVPLINSMLVTQIRSRPLPSKPFRIHYYDVILQFYSNIYPTRCNITRFILSGNCSTCFGRYHHPSSGAQTTVSTASGICHTVIAIVTPLCWPTLECVWNNFKSSRKCGHNICLSTVGIRIWHTVLVSWSTNGSFLDYWTYTYIHT